MISFFIHGIPKAQPRPRVTRTGHAYTPPIADAWKAQVLAAARIAIPPDWVPMDGPVGLRIEFFIPRPKCHFRSNGELRNDAPKSQFHTFKPDLDNLAKAVMDALSPSESKRWVGLWKDDCQVCNCEVRKRWAALTGGETQGALVFAYNPRKELV